MSAITRITSRSSVLVNSLRARSFNTAAAAAPAVEFPQFSNASDMSQYAESQVSSMDGLTLAKFLRYTHGQINRLPDGRDYRNSPAMRMAVSTAVKSVGQEDEFTSTRLMRAISDLAPSRNSAAPMPQYLREAGETFRHLVISKKFPLTSMNFADVLQSLCRLEGKDLELCAFAKEEFPKHLPQMTPSGCRIMMRVLYDMNIRDPEMSRMLGDKMAESLDQFKNSDVIGSLAIFAQINYTVGVVMKRCVELLTQHTSLFEAEELVSAAESLLQLQQFGGHVALPILEELQKRMRQLRAGELSRLLSIVVAAPRPDAQFASEIIGTLTSSSAPKTIGMQVNMAHAICTFNIQESKPLLQTLVNDLLAVESLNPFAMSKMVEIVESSKHDMDMRVELPPRFQTQLEEFHARQKTNGYTLMTREFIGKLSDKFRLSVETGVRVGPFMPSLVDTKNKVIIEVPFESTPLRLRRHLYEKLGYSSAVVKSSVLRRIKAEEGKIDYLESVLEPAMVNLGRMTMDEVNARRDAREAQRVARR